MRSHRLSLLLTACVGCPEAPTGSGLVGGARDAAPREVGARDSGGIVDLGRPDRGALDTGAPDAEPALLPRVDENVSLQIELTDYRRTGDASELPDDVRDNPPFAGHSIRVDVRSEISGGDAGGVLMHPPFGQSSGPYPEAEGDAANEIAFVSEVCAICVLATARVDGSRFAVARLVLGTVVDETGQRRWSGTGRIAGRESHIGAPVRVDAASSVTVRIDDVEPRARVETTPSVLLPFEGARLRFSEPVMDQATLIEVDTSEGSATVDAQPRYYGFDGGGSQVTGYDLSPAAPWPPGEITVRYLDPHVDPSGNVGVAEDFVRPVLRDPEPSTRVDFENQRTQDWSAWGTGARRRDEASCVESACLEFAVDAPGEAGVLVRLDSGSPVRAVEYRVRLLSDDCTERVDVFAIATGWGDVQPFAGRVGRPLTVAPSPGGGPCDSGWVALETSLATPAEQAWFGIELQRTRARHPSTVLLVDEIVPRGP